MDRLQVDGASIEYQIQGSGEPVLLIPPGGTIDGLGIPLFAQPELASRYQLINYHRRGYMGSTRGTEPLTIARQVEDVMALLRYLDVKTAHLAGHSIGGAIALQLAADVPEVVHTLALLEPALPMSANARAIMEQRLSPSLKEYQAGNTHKAMEIFGDTIFGLDWQIYVERAIPGGVEQTFKDADTFFREMPSVQTWEFNLAQVSKINLPVLSVVGAYSSPLMKEGRKLLHTWFPQTEDFDPPTTHLLQIQDPAGVAHGLAGFFSRHPLSSTEVNADGVAYGTTN